MKVFAIFLLFLFTGIVVLYVWISKVGSENLNQDRLLALQLNAQQALEQKRPDLALKYYDQGLKLLVNQSLPEQAALFFQGRGNALAALQRCQEAEQAWRRACQLGNRDACLRHCAKPS